jgi:hypothetical protein
MHTIFVPGGLPHYVPPDMVAKPPFVKGRDGYQFNDANGGDFHNTGEMMGIAMPPPHVTPTSYYLARGLQTQQKPAGVAGFVPSLLTGKV